jgi:hypothetical protein
MTIDFPINLFQLQRGVIDLEIVLFLWDYYFLR